MSPLICKQYVLSTNIGLIRYLHSWRRHVTETRSQTCQHGVLSSSTPPKWLAKSCIIPSFAYIHRMCGSGTVVAELLSPTATNKHELSICMVCMKPGVDCKCSRHVSSPQPSQDGIHVGATAMLSWSRRLLSSALRMANLQFGSTRMTRTKGVRARQDRNSSSLVGTSETIEPPPIDGH